MTVEYPDIKLINYIFVKRLVRNNLVDKNYSYPGDAYMFPQVWPNTGGGFAEPGYCYGQAMTKEYTTVMFDYDASIAMVFFGERYAYEVCNPLDNKAFMDDLMFHRMKSQYESKKYEENKNG